MWLGTERLPSVGLKWMAQLAAEAGRHPPHSWPLGMALFTPLSVGKSILVNMWAFPGLMCHTGSCCPCFMSQQAAFQVTHSHARSEGAGSQGKASSAHSGTPANPGTRSGRRTCMMRRKEEVQYLMGRSRLEFHVGGSARARATSLLNEVRDLCHP